MQKSYRYYFPQFLAAPELTMKPSVRLANCVRLAVRSSKAKPTKYWETLRGWTACKSKNKVMSRNVKYLLVKNLGLIGQQVRGIRSAYAEGLVGFSLFSFLLILAFYTLSRVWDRFNLVLQCDSSPISMN
jgi:hypothetical protein